MDVATENRTLQTTLLKSPATKCCCGPPSACAAWSHFSQSCMSHECLLYSHLLPCMFVTPDQGEARWDEPAAFQESTSHALIHRGYEEWQQEEGNVSIRSAEAYGGAALTEYHGEYAMTVITNTMFLLCVYLTPDLNMALGVRSVRCWSIRGMVPTPSP